jgi:hypothetical protein
MKPGNSEDIAVSTILHFVQGAKLLNAWANGLCKRLKMVIVHGSLPALPFSTQFNSIQFNSFIIYSILFYSN